jgi:hypothetical protein
MITRIYLVSVILILNANISFARVGIGAGAGLIYPGFMKSDINASQFELGPGYELFARHQLFQINSEWDIEAHYHYRKYFSNAELPFTADTPFSFDYIVFNLSTAFKKTDIYKIYGGAGIGLVNVQAQKDFLDVNESIFIPELLMGISYYLGEYYDAFLELGIQFGRVKVRDDDDVPLTGLRLLIGATMYLTD